MATKLALALDRVLDRLQWSQKEVFVRTGISSRTLTRWRLEGKSPSPATLSKLVRAVASVDPEAAGWLAKVSSVARLHVSTATSATTTAQSGAAAGASVAGPSVDVHLRVDSIVSVAADVMNLPPSAVRPALRAAFLRARDLGVSIEAIAEAMGEGAS